MTFALPDSEPIVGQALLHCSGADAQSFLQSQLINDVTQLQPNTAQLTGWCNPKGRLLNIFWLWQDPATSADELAYYLRLPAELLAAILPRLRLFVFRSKVTITDLTAEYAGYWSPPQSTPTAIPAEQKGMIITVPTGYETWLPNTNHNADEQQHSQRELAEIQAGLPEVITATSEQFIPQMLNMDQLNGMSFSKGCYPGQEITARLKYLGQIKKRLFSFKIDNASQETLLEHAAPNHGIYALANKSLANQDKTSSTDTAKTLADKPVSVGTILRSHISSTGAWGLAVCRVDNVHNSLQLLDGTNITLINNKIAQ